MKNEEQTFSDVLAPLLPGSGGGRHRFRYFGSSFGKLLLPNPNSGCVHHGFRGFGLRTEDFFLRSQVATLKSRTRKPEGWRASYTCR